MKKYKKNLLDYLKNKYGIEMINIDEIKINDKVWYQSFYHEDYQWRNGVIKEILDFTYSPVISCCIKTGYEIVKINRFVRVVFNWIGGWDERLNHPSITINIDDLNMGWRFPTEEEEWRLQNEN